MLRHGLLVRCGPFVAKLAISEAPIGACGDLIKTGDSIAAPSLALRASKATRHLRRGCLRFGSHGLLDPSEYPTAANELTCTRQRIDPARRWELRHGTIRRRLRSRGHLRSVRRLFLGAVPLLIWLAAGDLGNFTWAPAAVGVFGLGAAAAIGLLLLNCATEASTNYVVDDGGITRQNWTGTTRLAWSDLVRADEYCTSSSKGEAGLSRRCVLHGKTGERLTIWWPLVADCAALLARLEPRLAPLRQQDLLELAEPGTIFRPEWIAGVGYLSFMAPLFLLGGVAGLELVTTRPSEDGRVLLYLSLVAIAASPFVAALGVELVSRRLTLTRDGLALESLFLNRYVTFAGITSIKVEVTDAEEHVQERATIRAADGQSIAIHSGMPSYPAILGLVRKRAGTKSRALPLDDPEFF